jgi:hypothetical protein
MAGTEVFLVGLPPTVLPVKLVGHAATAGEQGRQTDTIEGFRLRVGLQGLVAWYTLHRLFLLRGK